MSANTDLPFNVEILRTDGPAFQMLKPVSTTDYFESQNGDLHDEGLFSTVIFGRMGDPSRDTRFSYANTRVDIFHPLIFRTLMQLRAFYKDLVAGKAHAVWDSKLRDFVPASELEGGQTGYAFFARHWRDIKFVTNESPIREGRIRLIEKYKDRAMGNRVVIMPAGLRDIEIGDDGRTSVGEINDLYRKLVSTASTIPNIDHLDDPAYDLSRNVLQRTFNEIYDAIETMLTGKRGFFQSKWGSRRIFNGTRNVITTMNVPTQVLGAPNNPKFTDTVIGLYQLAKGILPITIYMIREGYLSQVFQHGDGYARLVNPKTLQAEIIQLTTETYDRWATAEGVEKVLTSFKDVGVRSRPVMLDTHYLALLYAPPGQKVFRIFGDITELPEGASRDHVRPINLVEFLYLSGYKRWNDFAGIVTRYPVTGLGSTYPTTFYVKTTIRGEMRRELDENWAPIEGDDALALEFPTYEPLAFLDSLVVPSSRLVGMGADFDGDTASANIFYTDEALAEIRRMLRSKRAYVDPRGGMMASVDVDTIALVFRNFTRNPENP